MDADEELISGLEKARREAIIAVDKAALGALLSETLIWTHDSGGIDSKDSYLAALGTKARFLSMEVLDEKIAFYGSAAAVSSEYRMTIAVGDKEPIVLHTRGSSVWAKEADAWRLTRFQSAMVK
jgi:ketosteroid isomerase-like protein